jgi:hypothetical protein
MDLVLVPQNDDGTAHFTYYNLPHLLSFIWDGKSDHIEVSHGGYAEPVFDTMPVTKTDLEIGASSSDWMDWFRATCEAYIIINEGNLPT